MSLAIGDEHQLLADAEQAKGMRRRGLVLAALMRLKQICNHPAHALGDGSRLAGRSGIDLKGHGLGERAELHPRGPPCRYLTDPRYQHRHCRAVGHVDRPAPW